MTVFAAGCSDPPECVEGDDPVSCCSGGCGSSTEGWLPASCVNNRWQCERGTPLPRCTTAENACKTQDFCGGPPGPGIGGEEPDPVPELCCEFSCNGSKAARRICDEYGLKYVCPAGYTPISLCKNYMDACGGIIQKYRDNGNKLPPQ
jgi:hypothetical protein